MSTAGAQWALDVVDAAYRMAPSTADWLRGVVEAARPRLEGELGLTGSAFEWRDGELRFHALVQVGDLPTEAQAMFARGASHLDEEQRKIAYGPGPGPLESFHALMRRSLPRGVPGESACADEMQAWGIRDFLGAYGFDPSGRGYVLAAPSPRPVSVRRRDVAPWRKVRGHLLAGLRLHTAAAPPEAVLAPGGRVVHAEHDARRPNARAALRAASVGIDRARSRRGRSDPEAALLDWQGLVGGRWSLVDRFDTDGRRYIIARRNDPALETPRPLSPRQRQVLAYAALGHSHKDIAYELGLSASTVSTCLSLAMGRLGIRSRAELAELWSVLGRGAP